MPTFSIAPVPVAEVSTPLRRIRSPFPPPEAVPVLERLRAFEPASLSGQPPVLWDRASGATVEDRFGNRWIDFSSGVLVANAGHGRPEIAAAVGEALRAPLLHNYCFPSERRSLLVERLARMVPIPDPKVFLLTTGSEAIECVLKLARTFGRKIGPRKIGIVSFENAFHGRTMGAQMAGGSPALKEWISNLDPDMHQVPFPDGFRCKDLRFGLFEEALARKGVSADHVALVLMETYQGGGASFADPSYVRDLRRWCDRNRVLLACDEVQAGFGRTGRLFAFEHYGIVPDLLCLGKGITSSLPLSAVIGRAHVMDAFAPGTMTSTHTGNPLCVAAALANLDILEREGLVARAAALGERLHGTLRRIAGRFSDRIAALHGKGLVAGLHVVRPGGDEPDGEAAFRTAEACVRRGLLLFGPVGVGGATVKIAPPLVISEEALDEGLSVLEEALRGEMS